MFFLFILIYDKEKNKNNNNNNNWGIHAMIVYFALCLLVND